MKPRHSAWLPLLFLVLALSACGGLNESPLAGTGNVSVALTDAPSYAFDNVWVTVRAVWFHKVDTAPFDPTASGWVRFTLGNGVTVNLAALTGDSNVVTVFDNLALRAGTYRQMLLLLEPTENGRTVSANAAGLRFNNQVDAGTLRAALRVPNAAQGIRIAGQFVIAEGALLRLAIDFNVGRDVLPFDRGTVHEFLLQPRPVAFDLGNAGAIVGFIDTAAAGDSAALFEVLAEQIDTTLGGHVVRRAAAVDNATGRFVLYPLVPGTTAGQLYDIVIRGIGWQTAIVKSVPVTAGTTPGSGATILGTAAKPIPLTPAVLPDFRVAATISATSGALATFYQILGTDSPYVIRQTNFNPLSGTIADFPLSSALLNVDPFDPATYNGGTIVLSEQSPTPTIGNYLLVAESPLYDPSAPPAGGAPVDPSSIFSPVAITGLAPTAPAVSTKINVTATVPVSVVPMDNVVLFATFGGTILNALPLGNVPAATKLTNAVLNIPGGQSGSTFSLAFYGVSAYGWRTSIDNVLKIGVPVPLARPQTGDASVAFTIQNFPDP